MSATYISAELRRLVVSRSEGLCEYCLIAEIDTYFGCEVDHVISEKHGGPTTVENLAYCCFACNRFKGSDIGSIDFPSGQFIRFFNPRTDAWHHHFRLDGARIEALSNLGQVTLRILRWNSEERVLERQHLIASGRFPDRAAQRRAQG